ncbi:hypothetical protein MLD38_024429 [Melastoma candidum]|uniref:Uncharacterized protein n=2 Tax=Melastoma candidum TaxID=119954 RepID=A0ACB9NT70_9MYRT|nr:hypothetical protein MLD38_024428 [Melastoma candidum]KAI4339488.1 hypothetical protein MLD38_024429 [Melastoma candidum]
MGSAGLKLSPVFKTFAVLLFTALIVTPRPVTAQKLHTSSRWIVDEGGNRVKLACINWLSNLQPILAEGLHRQPVDALSASIKSMGFNCVRFTWPLYLATNESLSTRTVRQTFQELGLHDAIAGIESNNPSIVDLPTIEAYKAVLTSLRNNNVMVILDNHISTPGMCCIYDDGNSFFGDRYLDPVQWMEGLRFMATLATGFENVVGMSLRNELRGPRQNVDLWYKYMQQGAETVHAANPNVLVILSGLDYDTNLSFLQNRQVNVTFTKKVVFELHWYAVSSSNSLSEWVNGNLNEVCARVSSKVEQTSIFLRRQGFPLFLSEFGVDQTGTDENDARFFTCLLRTTAMLDLDFALWGLLGSYYLRDGIIDRDESYGILNHNWTGVRNSTFLQRISAIQPPFRGPGLKETGQHNIIFHPLTGMCVIRESPTSPLKLGSCKQSVNWIYTPRKNLMLKKKKMTRRYLQTDGPGKAVTIGLNLTTWERISASRMHLATNVGGKRACLDVEGQLELVARDCKCLSGDASCDPSSQWFILLSSTRLWRNLRSN